MPAERGLWRVVAKIWPYGKTLILFNDGGTN
jgi:hypothetical protein